MQSQRSILFHMLKWGTLAGSLLGALYGLSFIVPSFIEYPSAVFDELHIVVLIFLYGAAFGVVPGFFMGLAGGLVMSAVMRNNKMPLPLKRKVCYGVAVGIWGLVLILLSILIPIGDGFMTFVGLPAPVALGAFVLAVERYFARYREPRKKKVPPSA